jgi:hypothetical protein
MRWAILLALAIWGAALWGCGMTRAHEAPSGWSYPTSCCSGHDCYPVDVEEVEALPGGTYRIRRTGEVYAQPDLPGAAPPEAEGRVWRWSGDQDFHRCSPTGKPGDTTSLCLFVPRPGV